VGDGILVWFWGLTLGNGERLRKRLGKGGGFYRARLRGAPVKQWLLEHRIWKVVRTKEVLEAAGRVRGGVEKNQNSEAA
jgi:hypothetical protein